MKILLPVDGSPNSLAAVRHALQQRAHGLQASFVLVNVQLPATLYEMAVSHDVDALKALRTAAGADLLSSAETMLSGAGVPFETEVAGGEPQSILLELCDNYGCAAIIIGARGMGDPQASGLGSTVLGVLQHAAVPATVVRLPESDD